MKKQLLIFILILTSIMAFAEEYGNKESQKKVLIAYEKSKFKNILLKEIINKLNDGTIYIKTLDHTKEKLSNESPDKYSVVFISNSGVKSRLRPWVMDWIKEHQDLSNKIILHTTQKTMWPVKFVYDVDSITSASTRGEAKPLAEEIVNKINKFLQ